MIIVGTNQKGMKLLIKRTMIAMSIEIIDETKKVQTRKFQPVRLSSTKVSIIPIQ